MAVKGASRKRGPTDDRLPVRWALILLVAAAAGIGAGVAGGLVAGWGTALATAAILHKVVGT
jgi:hypothetical protein